MKLERSTSPDLKRAAETIVPEICRLLAGRKTPLVVALDGGSGSGKSAIAALVAEACGAASIPGDDFFAAGIPDAEWELRTPEERARDAIDWRRLRAEALDPLIAGKPAQWHKFDFEAGPRPDGTYAMRPDFVRCEPKPVIVLDGAYSARPELADLIDFSVLVDVPVVLRHQRLAAREEKSFLASWHERWDRAEEYYFTQVKPKSSFDSVVVNAAIPEDDKS